MDLLQETVDEEPLSPTLSVRSVRSVRSMAGGSNVGAPGAGESSESESDSDPEPDDLEQDDLAEYSDGMYCVYRSSTSIPFVFFFFIY